MIMLFWSPILLLVMGRVGLGLGDGGGTIAVGDVNRFIQCVTIFWLLKLRGVMG
jgi:hypothetical protein